MSTKPIDTGRFAVDGADADTANISAPSSGLRDTGWPNNYVPPAGEFNYLDNLAYRWRKYLSDGDFQGLSTFSDFVTVGGQPLVFADMTFTADHTVNRYTVVAHGFETGDGPVRVATTGTLPAGLAAATDYWVIQAFVDSFYLATSLANAKSNTILDITTNGTGTHTISDTAGTERIADLTVTRDVLVNRNMQVDGNSVMFGELQLQTLNLLGTGTATGEFTHIGGTTFTGTATVGLAAAANQSFTVSGTGRYKHGTYERTYHISAFQVDGATTYVTFNQIGYISGFSATCTVQCPLPLDVGKRILSYAQTYDVQGTGAGIQPSLKRIEVATATVSNVVLGTSDNTGTGIETQTMSAINHVVVTGFAYYISVNVTNAAHRVYSATITYDDP